MTRQVQGNVRGAARQADRSCVNDAIARLSSITHPHQVPVTALVKGEATPMRHGTAWIRRSRRRLVRSGLSEHEAGNVVAYAAGLHATSSGWSTGEVERLIVLRALVACGQLPS